MSPIASSAPPHSPPTLFTFLAPLPGLSSERSPSPTARLSKKRKHNVITSMFILTCCMCLSFSDSLLLILASASMSDCKASKKARKGQRRRSSETIPDSVLPEPLSGALISQTRPRTTKKLNSTKPSVKKEIIDITASTFHALDIPLAIKNQQFDLTLDSDSEQPRPRRPTPRPRHRSETSQFSTLPPSSIADYDSIRTTSPIAPSVFDHTSRHTILDLLTRTGVPAAEFYNLVQQCDNCSCLLANEEFEGHMVFCSDT